MTERYTGRRAVQGIASRTVWLPLSSAMHHRGSARLGSAHIAAIAIAGVLAACSEPPVAWTEIRSGTSFVGDALAPDGSLLSDSMSMLAARIPAPESSVCPGSL